MSSATRSIVAGAILALSGSPLISIAQPPQPIESPLSLAASASASSPEILPGVELATEEVEPGVLRVLSDGVHGLTDTSQETVFDGISAGLDGSVWVFRSDGFFRLGDKRTHEWASDYTPAPWGVGWRRQHVSVARDGTLWRTTPTEFRFDGRSWTTPRIAGHKPAGCRGNDRRWCVMGVATSANGSVWLTLDEGGQIARLRDGKWRSHLARDGWVAMSGTILGASDAGDVYLIEEPDEDTGLAWITRTRDGRDWQVTVEIADLFERAGHASWEMAAVGPDGTVWIDFYDKVARMAFDRASAGLEWQVYDSPGIGVGEDLCGLSSNCDLMEVAPDQTLWASLSEGDSCGGLGHITGRESTRYLEGHCVKGLDIGRDGSVWVQAWAPGGPLETYVVPSQVAATA